MSLSKLISTTLLLIPLVMIMFTCLSSIILIRDTMDQMISKNTLLSIKLLADESRQHYISGNFNDYPTTDRPISTFRFFDDQGAVLARFGNDRESAQLFSLKPSITALTLNEITATAPVLLESTSPTQFQSASPIGFISAVFKIEYEYKIIETVISVLVFISVIIYLVTIPLTLYLSKKITGNLNHIVQAIDTASKQTSNQTIKKMTQRSKLREIQAISESFNRFVDQLVAYQKINDTLTANLKQEAQKSILDRSQILAAYSHEMRIPLHNIRTHAHLLKSELVFVNNKKLREMFSQRLQLILGSEASILHRVDSILAVCRQDSILVQPNKLELGPWFSGFCESIRPLVDNSTNHLIIEDLSERQAIITDQELLEQILIVMIDNACKFTHHGVIKCSIKPYKTNMMCFEVADSGTGIMKKDYESIFNPFIRIDTLDGKHHEGLGLGLYIASKLTRALSGKIRLKSQPKIGSQFSVILPLEKMN